LVSSSSSDDNIFGYVRNLHYAVGDTVNIPTITDTSVRGLLTAIKQNTASGNDLTTVNEKITALATTVGPTNSTATDNNLLGSVRNIVGTLGSSNGGIFLKDKTIRALLYNLREGIGNAENSPTTTGNTVRDLLTAIKENTASGGSGGGGGSADLTTVNEKTTALAAAIGSASDDSSTVSVIGLLKSITDKY